MSSEPQYISSTQNPKIKHLLALQQKSSERRKSGLFVVEGRRELEHCIAAGYEVESVYVLEKPLSNSPRGGEDSFVSACTYIVSPHVYERIAYRGSTEGIIAIVRAKNQTLEDLLPSLTGEGVGEGPLFVVLESVEKPGNLGAVLRSADAAGATAVIVCDPLTDLYNPNLIRASIGACFTVPTVACTSEECIAFLKSHGVQILTAQLALFDNDRGACRAELLVFHHVLYSLLSLIEILGNDNALAECQAVTLDNDRHRLCLKVIESGLLFCKDLILGSRLEYLNVTRGIILFCLVQFFCHFLYCPKLVAKVLIFLDFKELFIVKKD